ncbi:MAG: hypothetical protein L0H93_18975 [Nocardioides sp.]|nr:hypothetical protein [Nocardioides sp.]
MPVRVDPSGMSGPTPRNVRSRRWRRTSRGLFVPSSVDGTLPEQRTLEASMVLPLGGAVTGWAALRWCGSHWFDGLTPDGRRQLPVTLLTGDHNIRSQPGYVVSEERRPLHELMVVDGIVVTTHVRSVGNEMRYAANERAAVIAFDMAAYADLVSIEEMAAYLATISGWTGVPQARAALPSCDENSWSPRESAMRRIWEQDAGLPRPLCNRPIFDRQGNLIGAPDLLDLESGLIGEYDGELHLVNERRVIDREREGKFRRVGLECVTMVRGDSAHRADIVRLILEARDRAKFESESDRLWTVEEPPWWTPTYTVAQRRALDSSQRERFLRHRRRAA